MFVFISLYYIIFVNFFFFLHFGADYKMNMYLFHSSIMRKTYNVSSNSALFFRLSE